MGFRAAWVWVAAVVAALAVAGVGFARDTAPAAVTTGVVNITTNLAYDSGSAAGTGIVISSNGRVLTNNHVIKGATSIRVTLPSSGRSFSASVLGYSVAGDIALLQVKSAAGLTAARLGSSADLRVGQRVTAVGNAGGRGTASSSTGRITALGRTITVSEGRRATARLANLIQIDAPLEPGDSGGPLLDAANRVIGMDAAASVGFRFETSSEGYAIPINRALAVAKQILARRSSATVQVGSTPLLGVSISSDSFGYGDEGAYVVGVAEGSPADDVGIGSGSTIVRIDGRDVGSHDELTALLLRRHGGDVVTVTWVDDAGARHTAKVKTVSGPPQ